MSTYDVVGLKIYSNELQLQLDRLIKQEQMNPKPWTNKLRILMLSVNDFVNSGMMEKLNEDYGKHSHYMFFNEHATNMLREYSIPLKIIGRTEIKDDDIGVRYARLIENSRFVNH